MDHVPERDEADALAAAEAAGARLRSLVLTDRAAADVRCTMVALASRRASCLSTVECVRVQMMTVAICAADVDAALLACPRMCTLILEGTCAFSVPPPALARVPRTIVRCMGAATVSFGPPFPLGYSTHQHEAEQAQRVDAVSEDVAMVFERDRLTHWHYPMPRSPLPAVAVLPRTWLRRMDMRDAVMHVESVVWLLSEASELERLTIRGVEKGPCTPDDNEGAQPKAERSACTSHGLRSIELSGDSQDIAGLAELWRALAKLGAHRAAVRVSDGEAVLTLDGSHTMGDLGSALAVLSRRPGGPKRVRLEWAKEPHGREEELAMSFAVSSVRHLAAFEEVCLFGWMHLDADVSAALLSLGRLRALVIDSATCRATYASGSATPDIVQMAAQRSPPLLPVRSHPLMSLGSVRLESKALPPPPPDVDDETRQDDDGIQFLGPARLRVDCSARLWHVLSRRMRPGLPPEDASSADMFALDLTAGHTCAHDVPALRLEGLDVGGLAGAVRTGLRIVDAIAPTCSMDARRKPAALAPMWTKLACNVRYASRTSGGLKSMNMDSAAAELAGKAAAAVIAATQAMGKVLHELPARLLASVDTATAEQLAERCGVDLTKVSILAGRLAAGEGHERARLACSEELTLHVAVCVRKAAMEAALTIASSVPFERLMAMMATLPEGIGPADAEYIARSCGTDGAEAALAPASVVARDVKLARLSFSARRLGGIVTALVLSEAAFHRSTNGNAAAMAAAAYVSAFGRAFVRGRGQAP